MNDLLFFHITLLYKTYATIATGGASGLIGLMSLDGPMGTVSSFGSTTDTLSGRGRLGPILPLGSQGNIILT